MKKSAKSKSVKKASTPGKGKNGLKPILNRLDRLEEGQVKLEERQAKLEEGQAKLEKRQAKLEEGQARLEEGQAKLVSGQESLKEKLNELEERMDQKILSARDDLTKLILAGRDENARVAAENDRKISRLLTIMDGVARDYERWLHERAVTNMELDQHGQAIDELKEKDLKKEIAIQDLQQRVTALENATDGRSPTPESSVKE